MPRRVIATAEVQVAADVKQAEVGLNGLTEAFKTIGRNAEQAAERAELAFFNGARTMQGGFRKVIQETEALLAEMRKAGPIAENMANSLEQVYRAARKIKDTDMRHLETLRVFKEIAGAAGAIDLGLHDAAATAARLKRETQEVEGAIRAAERDAELLADAFRDVGRQIDLVMSGGDEGLQNDIRETIRRLEDMGGEFRDVGRIGEAALDGIMSEFDNDVDGAVSALFRLERQLRDVEFVADKALEGLDNDADQATAALLQMARAADRADRSLNDIDGAARRVSGNMRGLIGYMGAAGFGYAAYEAARFGLDMTIQLEKAEAMFLGLTGSVAGASDMLERMVTFARETPYNLANVTESAAQLLAVGDGFGVTTENIERYLTSFGNAITMTGGGDEQFTRLVRVFGQMSSSGKVLGQDMNQLAQNLPGYDVWQALADGANTSVEELRRLQNIGQLDELLTGNEAVQILIDGMEEIPGAAGAMERRMNTLGGAIEKFKETAQLAVSEGMEPFADTAQDVLSDPVILNSVEDLANAFGDLLSSGLEEVAPELDDLSAAAAGLIDSFDSWAPIAGVFADSVADILRTISPLVEGLGSLASAVLDFGDGLGKAAVGAALVFGPFGPIGLGAGILLGVGGALDIFGSKSEDAAELARLLAAAQTEVNDAMSNGEDVVLSEAQRLAVETAQQLIDKYPELATKMEEYGVSVNELRTSLLNLADGTGEVAPGVQAMMAAIEDTRGPRDRVNALIEDFEAFDDALRSSTESAEQEIADQTRAFELGGAAEIASLEERREAQRAHAEAVRQYWDDYGDNYAAALDSAGDSLEGFQELEEDQLEKLKGILEDQRDAYIEWEQDINDSTSAAAFSFSDVADEVDNNVGRMIDRLQQNTLATYGWKDAIVTAASGLVNVFGVPEEEAQEFMAFLGDLGPDSAPMIADLVANLQGGGDEILQLFNAAKENSAVFESDLNSAFDNATNSVPSLVESLADGTASVEDILATLPELMEEAGMDFEATAAAIDASDEMTVVGREAAAGLVAGLEGGIAAAAAASARLAAAAVQAARWEFRVSSPSRVMMEIGEYVVEGLIVGMQSMSSEAYAEAVQTASLIGGGIEHYFRDADDPREEAIKFAKDISNAIVEELLAERESVADAAESLAEAAADRLAEAWDRVKDRFRVRDIKETILDAQAELAESKAELRSAESLAGAGGNAAVVDARRRLAKAEQMLAAAEAADVRGDAAADRLLDTFQKATEDQASALRIAQEDQYAALVRDQEAEIAGIQQRIATATRNLDPVLRAAAEADLIAVSERQEAERIALERRQDAEATALTRRREAEESALELRLDKEDEIREAAIKAKEDEASAFEKALDEVVKSVAEAISGLPALREGVGSSERDVQEAFLDQFERMLDDVDSVDRSLLTSVGAQAGLTSNEVQSLINSALSVSGANSQAAAAARSIDEMLTALSSGLYTMGANGALGIAAGLSAQSAAVANAMRDTVQGTVNAALRALDINSPSKVTADLIGEPMARYAMSGLLDNIMSDRRPPSASRLVANESSSLGWGGPLVSMPGAVIQDATDADLVAQRLVVALSATGMV